MTLVIISLVPVIFSRSANGSSFMKSRLDNYTKVIRALVLVTLCLTLFGLTITAQPERAEALFAEAKQLATKESIEEIETSFPKFEEALKIFKTAGHDSKAEAVELEYGRTLRALAVREMHAKHYDNALAYFSRALDKFHAARSALQIAYVCHDAAWMLEQQNQRAEAIRLYNSPIEAYRAAGEKNGEAIVTRNLASINLDEKKYAEALAFYEAALKLRVETGDLPSQAILSLDIGGVHEVQKKYPPALEMFNRALALYRQAKDQSGEADALYRLGTLPAQVVRSENALEHLESALRLYQQLKNAPSEATTLWMIGRTYVVARKPREAERYLSQAVDAFAVLKDASGEGAASLDAAANYETLNRYQLARPAVERSLRLGREAKDRTLEASALLVFAEVHSFYNEHQEAYAKIIQAQKIFKETSNTYSDFRIGRAFTMHYYSLSNYGEAIRMASANLKLAGDDPELQASAYIDLSNSYSALGEDQKSIDYTTKALEIARKTGNIFTESISLSNIGYSYYKLNKLSEAEPFMLKAIELMRANGFALEEGYSVHNLGLVYYKRGDHARALANYDRALPLYRAAADRRPESFLYDSYGELYRDLGQYDKAIENLQKAIVLAREIRYSNVEAQALANMMKLWMARKQPRLGILYGKQAVNVYQAIRAGNKTLDTSSQKSLVKSNEETYRKLANLLIEEGRLAEAQQVLDLLKAEEYFDFVRRDASEADETAALALSESERKALEEYSRVSASLTSLGAQFQTLQDKKNKAGGKLPETEEAEYAKLKEQVETAGAGLKTFFAKLESEFSKKVEDGTVVTPQSIETLKADLRRAGTDVVLVSTYLLPERYRAIVTTGRAMVDRKVEYSSIKLSGADINRKIFEFQRALQNPKVDPRKLGKELYDIFVKPLEGDLKGAGAKTILWSLDGSLRYIPMAALSPDGKTYLADRYQNVVVTLGRQTNLFAKPSGEEWRAIGAGVSKQHAGFSALPGVPEEIGSIVRDGKQVGGVLDGTRLLDEQFNLESLRNTVPQQTEDGKTFNVLHLATHFSLGANDQDSALLLGDGKRLSLFEIGRDEALDFKDVELLTLSACQTGVSTGDANGREVESLGMLAQKKGAKAVLATLWKVADESTSLFMAEFYRIKKANPTMNKAEAIRLAQKEMIEGRIKASGKSNGCRAEQFASGAKQGEFKCDPNAPYSHPYFWSPFVLIGNWR